MHDQSAQTEAAAALFILSFRHRDELLAAAPGEEDKPRPYGLGVYVTQSELGTSYGPGGWSPGYLSRVEYYPAQRVAAAVQINTDARDDMLGDWQALVKELLDTVGELKRK